MPPPLAYFLTWTCYGTRLHGDERGTVDRDHNIPGTPFLAPDTPRKSHCLSAMKWPIYLLNDTTRPIVDDVLREHCQIQKWAIIEKNVRTTHVHIIVDCFDSIDPDSAMEQFKAYGTRRVRQKGHAAPKQQIWTEGGSTRWLNSEKSLIEAINYTRNCQ